MGRRRGARDAASIGILNDVHTLGGRIEGQACVSRSAPLRIKALRVHVVLDSKLKLPKVN